MEETDRLKVSARVLAIHPRKVLQPSVDLPTGSVATEVAASVATSLTSASSSALPPSVTKADSPDLPPLNAETRAVESPTLPQKKRRHPCSASRTPSRSQRAHRERFPSLRRISWEMVDDTIQYLQTLSDRAFVSGTIFPSGWATIHVALSCYRAGTKRSA